MTQRLAILVGLAIFMAVISTGATAQIVSNTDDFPTPGGNYNSTGSPPVTYNGGTQGTYQVDYFLLKNSPISGPGIPPTLNSFFDVFVTIETPTIGSGPVLSGNFSIPSAPVQVNITPINPIPPIRIYNTEMVQLSITGGTLPGGVLIRESPTLPSSFPGPQDHTVVGNAPPFLITSFFDVFTELSVDGGNLWIPASGPIHLNNLPEPSSLSLLLLAPFMLKRRRAA